VGPPNVEPDSRARPASAGRATLIRVPFEAIVRRHSTRLQRTLRRPVEVNGVGFLTGSAVQLRFVPAPPSSGVVFVRRDLPGQPSITAHVSQVTGTQRRTTLGQAPVQVALVEHVLAALAGLRIDNCQVELNAPEPPGLDGSARGFTEALARAGFVVQPARRSVWQVEEAVTVRAGGATLTLYPPADDRPALTLTYFLDYGPGAPIGRQIETCELTPGLFMQHLAPARTFLLEAEAAELRRQGLGARTTAADLLVYGPHGPIDNVQRWANEPARHKVLDMVGDLSLVGADLCGHVIAYRSGHPLNVELARALHQRLTSALGRMAAA
jgi:UDP-3-O-acyl N-acetylglucosamine deacetylase